MSQKLQDLTPDTRAVAERFIEEALAAGIQLRVVSGLRTCEQQASIYNQGRTTPGRIVSGASGCRSWHVWGRAFDVLIVEPDGRLVTNGADQRYDVLGDLARSLGLIWGGTFSWGRDAGHFEYHPGLSIDDVCPDKSAEACQEQVSRHNAANTNVPPAISVVVSEEAKGTGIGVITIATSAFIGALVYQVVAKLMNPRQR